MFDLNILEEARDNDNFRKVLFTGEHTQVVVMSLKVGEDIGLETHHHNDQILLIVDGRANLQIGDAEQSAAAGGLAVVPAGTPHNVTNTGDTELKLITIYGPPDHEAGTVHATKADALEDEGPAEQ